MNSFTSRIYRNILMLILIVGCWLFFVFLYFGARYQLPRFGICLLMINCLRQEDTRYLQTRPLQMTVNLSLLDNVLLTIR